MKRFWKAWLPVILCASLIWGLGGSAFSHSETSRFLEPMLRWLLPDIGPEAMQGLLFWIRKAMHPAEYGLLSILIWRAGALTWPLSPLRLAGLALAGVAVLAGADELRQSFSAARTGSALDALLDIGGGTIALLALFTVEHALGRPLFGPPPHGSE